MSLSCTFGSFGDIATLVQFAAALAQTLSESRGASAEYQDLIAELDALEGILRTVQGPTPRSPDADHLQREVARCAAFLGQVRRRVEQETGFAADLELALQDDPRAAVLEFQPLDAGVGQIIRAS